MPTTTLPPLPSSLLRVSVLLAYLVLPFHLRLASLHLGAGPGSATAARALVTETTKKAVAVRAPPRSRARVITLTQDDDGPKTVNDHVTGLTPGLHGFHLVDSDCLDFFSMSLVIIQMAA
ncbi:hypothetical protein ACP4OV_012038 [Aristida adscensionis]